MVNRRTILEYDNRRKLATVCTDDRGNFSSIQIHMDVYLSCEELVSAYGASYCLVSSDPQLRTSLKLAGFNIRDFKRNKCPIAFKATYEQLEYLDSQRKNGQSRSTVINTLIDGFDETTPLPLLNYPDKDYIRTSATLTGEAIDRLVEGAKLNSIGIDSYLRRVIEFYFRKRDTNIG